MSKLNRPYQLADARFVATLPHKISRDEFREIYRHAYRTGFMEACNEMRAKLTPTTAGPQASPSTPTPNDTDPQHAGRPSILTQEIAG